MAHDPTNHDGVVIVGASLAGLHTADALRAEGWDRPITLIDAHREPHYDRPPMSKGYLGGSVEAERLLLRDRDHLERASVDRVLGRAATGLDTVARTVRLADGREIGYGELVIATGVAPIVPTALAIPSAYTLRNKEDADALRAHVRPGGSLIVIGAGFIGLEVAATFRSGGASVDVVEALPTPLHRQVGPRVGDALRRLHEAHGVRFHLGHQAAAAEERAGAVVVTLDDGTVLTADALLVAVGSRPGTGWLEGSSLKVDGGLVTDEHLVAAAGVHGVGDVVRWPHPLVGRLVRVEHWTNAVEQAKYVAKRIAGTADQKPFAALPYFWSDQYDRRIQAHGFPDGDAEVEVLDGDLDGERFAALYLTGGRATAVVGMNNAKQVLVGRRRVVADLTPQEVSS